MRLVIRHSASLRRFFVIDTARSNHVLNMSTYGSGDYETELVAVLAYVRGLYEGFNHARFALQDSHYSGIVEEMD